MMLKMIVQTLLIASIFFYSLVNAQKIIFLNGTTTSGKSSIARELQALLAEQSQDVEVIALDDFIIPAVAKLLFYKRLTFCNITIATLDLLSSHEMESIVQACRVALCSAVKEAYDQGKTVVIDDVMYRDDHINFYTKAFADMNFFKVLVYCPILTVIYRIIHRNNNSGLTEQRFFFEALEHFTHLYQKEENELVSIDNLSKMTLETACSNAMEQHIIMQDNIPDLLKVVQNALCPRSFDQIQQSIIEKFALDNNQEIFIGPVIQHNCIVNTEDNSSVECAEKIMKALNL